MSMSAPGPEIRDYLCGHASDDGHTGTDFRLLNLKAAKGVEVKAAAAGVVAKTREGIEDKMVTTEADVARVNPIGLGNVVIVDHGQGWQTIYGHMRKGSLKVRSGDTVAAGTPLGEVGLSGLTEYAHVHFEVRHDGKVVDPYTGVEESVACALDASKATEGALWSPEVLAATASNESRILDTGFAGGPVTPAELEIDLAPEKAAGPTSPGLVFYARIMNMRTGDQLRFVLKGPGSWGPGACHGPGRQAQGDLCGLCRTQAASADRWPAGRYSGVVEFYRAGRVVARAQGELVLPE